MNRELTHPDCNHVTELVSVGGVAMYSVHVDRAPASPGLVVQTDIAWREVVTTQKKPHAKLDT